MPLSKAYILSIIYIPVIDILSIIDIPLTDILSITDIPIILLRYYLL